MNRRSFLKQTGIAVGLTAAHSLRGATQPVSIVVDPQDQIASAAAPSWAVRALQDALGTQGISAKVYPRIAAAPAGDRHILVAGAESAAARQILKAAKVSIPSGSSGPSEPLGPEGLYLAAGNTGGRSVLLAGGTSERG